MEQCFVGLDVHKDLDVGCVLDGEGKVQCEQGFPSTLRALERFMSGVPSRNTVVVLEACGVWRGAYKRLRSLGYAVRLANPVTTHAIAVPHKTDKVDARTLADLARTGYLPEVYVPSDEMLRFRDLARHKAMLVRLRTTVQVKLKSYLLREGLNYSKGLWTKQGLEQLRACGLPWVVSYARMYEAFKTEEALYMRLLRNTARNHRVMRLLQSCPGIAEFSSMLILSEVADITRFPNKKHFVAYCGLAKARHQSGSSDRQVRRTSFNHWLKWILVVCSGRASMMPGRFQNYYQRLKKRKGFKVARIATARKMAEVMYEMLLNQEPYRP